MTKADEREAEWHKRYPHHEVPHDLDAVEIEQEVLEITRLLETAFWTLGIVVPHLDTLGFGAADTERRRVGRRARRASREIEEISDHLMRIYARFAGQLDLGQVIQQEAASRVENLLYNTRRATRGAYQGESSGPARILQFPDRLHVHGPRTTP